MAIRKDFKQYINMQSNKIHRVFLWLSLFITYVSSTCFGPHRSIIRSVLYKLYSQIWYVVIRVLRSNGWTCRVLRVYYHIPKSANTFLQLCNGWTCRVVRVFPHTKSAHTACTKRSWRWTGWGPKHVELTYVMNKTHSLKTLCVSCWTAHILQDDTRSVQYQYFKQFSTSRC